MKPVCSSNTTAGQTSACAVRQPSGFGSNDGRAVPRKNDSIRCSSKRIGRMKAHEKDDATVSEHYLTMKELQAGLDEIRRAPKDHGLLRLIVRRPQVKAREVLQVGELDLVHGLVGDSWSTRQGGGHPEKQLNVMNARAIALVARSTDRWALAGDQLFIDLDVSVDN